MLNRFQPQYLIIIKMAKGFRVRRRKVFRLKKRRTIRRRKAYRRSRGSKYDGVVKRKIILTENMLFNAATNYASVVVSWYGSFANPNYVTVTPYNFTEFQNFAGIFQQFCISGVKMTLEPIQMVTTRQNVAACRTITAASLTNQSQFGAALTEQSMRGMDDFKEWNGSMCRYAKKYVGVSKYLKRNLKPKWHSTNGAILPAD